MTRRYAPPAVLDDPGPLDWQLHAKCREYDPDLWFVDGAKQHEIVGVCRRCPVWPQCLAYALDNRIDPGVWGGKTERERRWILNHWPHIRSWLPYITGDMDIR